MPNIKSAEKRVKVSAVKAMQNKMAKTGLKSALKRFEEGVKAEPQNAQALYNEAAHKVDQAAAKGLIHPNNAAHKKSAMARAVKDAAN